MYYRRSDWWHNCLCEDYCYFYGDNKNIIADGVPEIEAYMKEVLPDLEAEKRFKEELLEIVPDVSQFLPDIA